MVATLAVLGAERAGGGGLVGAGMVAEADSCAFFDHEHSAWTAVLARYVRDGFVDYAGMKRVGAKDLAA